MSAELVVVRGDGALWGVPAAAVAAVEGRLGGVLVRLLTGREIVAEAVVGLAHGAQVRALSRAVRRRMPRAASGLALWEAEPVVVLDLDASQQEGGQ